MVRRISHIVIIAASFAIGACLATPSFAAPIHPVELGKGAASALEQASFWGLPYPYGYAYRDNPCVRHVRVQTKAGWRMRRIWVCEESVVLK